MAIAIDEVVVSNSGSSASSPIVVPKVGATSPTALTVEFTLFNGASTVAPSSVFYGGTPITISSVDLWPSSPSKFVTYYGSLINPPSGANSFTVSFSGTATLELFATFWTGNAGSVSWTTRAGAAVSPVVSVARAASSGLASFVINQQPAAALNTFYGPGTERVISPSGERQYYAATQEPAQGSGSIDWQFYDELREEYSSLTTSHITAEVIEAPPAVPMGGAFQLMYGKP